jgi:hypothetical protein
MSSLRNLNVFETQLGDRSIESLLLLPLETLSVSKTQMTQDGVERLKTRIGTVYFESP